jgi:hypothetical protein
MSSPNIPPPPPPPQEIKQPDQAQMNSAMRRNRAGSMMGGSLLTGPSGVAQGALTTGKTSLLGQ